MIVYCNNKSCIYRKDGQCTLDCMHYENKICASYCSQEGIKQAMKSNMPRVHREHNRIKANDNKVLM